MATRFSPRRLLIALLVVSTAIALPYAVWTPGKRITDGRHDRGRNGIWMQHGWLGADEWFDRNGKRERIPLFRTPERLTEPATKLRANHITDVYPHLCPADPKGPIAPV